jgi:NAD+ diphosphatase
LTGANPPAAPSTGPRRPLGPLALARSAIDRAAHHRGDAGWLAQAWADPRSQVLVVDEGQSLVRFTDSGASLVLVSPDQAPDGLRVLLGVDADDRAYFAVLAPLPASEPAPGPEPGRGAEPADRRQLAALAGHTVPAGLRRVGTLLDDRDAGLLTQAVALSNWHATHTHCPRCGTPTDPIQAGHARRCPKDGSEHFPRTDPAVIMLVTDPDDRILLGQGRNWGARRMSVLAGFVEAGESAEQAVAREVAEETGIVVGDVRYLGSQPWPLPQSLMLGFWAKAAPGQRIQVDPEEITEALWFSREELRDAVSAGELGLPGAVSIAHRIIEAWYGEELPGGWTSPSGTAQPRS